MVGLLDLRWNSSLTQLIAWYFVCKLVPSSIGNVYFSINKVLNSGLLCHGIIQENSRGSRRGDCGITAIAASKGRTPPSGERALRGIWTDLTGREDVGVPL